MQNYLHICKVLNLLQMKYWNKKIKRLLKAELLKKGITNSELVLLLNNIGVEETKSSIDSKISRGTFSAAFFLQCMTAINCSYLHIDTHENLTIAAESKINYEKR